MGRKNHTHTKPQGHKTRKAVAVSVEAPAPRKPAPTKALRVGQVSAEWQSRRGA
jgi:hypothetical protein